MTWLAVVQTLAGHRHERRIVLLALAVLTALAWVYLWRAPMPMPAANGGLRTPEYASNTMRRSWRWPASVCTTASQVIRGGRVCGANHARRWTTPEPVMSTAAMCA